MIKVSIVVPVYNVEKYLQRCVDSILSQTYKSFEVILVDDGSTDKSALICDEFLSKDTRVRVIHKQNAGVSNARNSGIEASTGDFIMFVDSDDYIKNNMLEEMVKNIQDDTDLIVSSIQMVTKKETFDFLMSSRAYNPKELMEDYLRENFPRICVCGPCCKLYKRDLIFEQNIRFDSKMSLGEDTDFNLKYIRFSKKIISMEESFYMYMRDNEDSLFSKFRSNYYNDITNVFDNTVEFAKELGCSADALSQLKQFHCKSLLSNVIKSVVTAEKADSILYMKNLGSDENFKRSLNLYQFMSPKYVTVLLINYKQYGLVYYYLFVRYKLFSFLK